MAGFDPTIVIASRLRVREDSRAEFLSASLDLVAPTRAEDGCVAYGLYEDAGEPNAFLFHEEWRDRRAFDAHHASPAVAAYERRVPGWLADDVRVEIIGVATIERMSAKPSRGEAA